MAEVAERLQPSERFRSCFDSFVIFEHCDQMVNFFTIFGLLQLREFLKKHRIAKKVGLKL